MGEGIKTDNALLAPKLELRRYFLKKYHAGGDADVFDCCQGSGLIWQHLKNEFPIRSYWGVDVKPKAGRLKIDSARVLAQEGWKANVVDVDTYGLPWKHLDGIMRNGKMPITVFLTIGDSTFAGGGITLQDEELNALGMMQLKGKLPKNMTSIRKIATDYMLAEPLNFGLRITESIEAFPQRKVRYVGMRLEE